MRKRIRISAIKVNVPQWKITGKAAVGCLRQIESDMRWPSLRNEDNEEVKRELLRKDQLKYKSIEAKVRGM